MKPNLKSVTGNRQRGVTMAGMLVLAVILAAWCALVLDHSVESYRSGTMLVWRLQARAAAEGVAVLLAANPARPVETQTLGAATVTCGQPTPSGSQETLVPLEVAIRANSSTQVRYNGRFQARFERGEAGWRLLRVEE